LHIGIDTRTGEIVAIELTEKDVDDAAWAGALLDQITDPVASFTADGAYDQDRGHYHANFCRTAGIRDGYVVSITQSSEGMSPAARC
jgi:hypothetical protein